MSKCLCGCGQEVREGRTFVSGGHAAKYRKQQKIASQGGEIIKKNNQERIKPIEYKEISREGILTRAWNSVFHRSKKPQIVEVESPEDLIEGLKPYEIPQTDPKSGLGKLTKRDRDYIQVVLVSELIEPKTFWAEKTGMNRIQYKDRMFKLPRDIKGNVFFWHIDKKEPLIDSAHANETDAESSFHELQLFNMAYSVGRAAGANDLMNNIKLILLIVGLGIFVSFIIIGYLYNMNKHITADYENMIQVLNTINQTLSIRRL